MPTAIITSAVIGGGAAVASGAMQSSAINKASKQQQAAADQSIAYQQQARDYARQVLAKYSVEGDAARAKMNTFLGLNPKPPSSMQGYSGALGNGQNRPVRTAITNRYGETTELLPDFQDAMGQAQPAADPNATPAETQEQAWAAYQQTPWGRIGQMEADRAGQSFLSKAGAQGSALSGRVIRGQSELGNENQLRNFAGYYGALGGVADTGFNADTGIASGGQTFANNASNVLAANATAQANASYAKGQNASNTVNDLASWVGWGMGQWPSSGGGTSQSNIVSPTSSGRTTSGIIGRIL